MKDALTAAGTRSAACLLLRRYGHGVPTFERAAASARNHLAMISEAEIQPYSRSGKGMHECHFYSLPWPRTALESLGEQDVTLKITLSYFVEPNPGSSAAFDPYRYQSFGLRFDLKRRSETVINFAKRLNKKAWEQPKDRPSTDPDGDRWLFGAQSMSAGSLHSDEWRDPQSTFCHATSSASNRSGAGGRNARRPMCEDRKRAIRSFSPCDPRTVKSISTRLSRPWSRRRSGSNPSWFRQAEHRLASRNVPPQGKAERVDAERWIVERRRCAGGGASEGPSDEEIRILPGTPAD